MLRAPLLSRMLIATVLGFAAMVLAATGAQAHAGHDHARHTPPAAVHHHGSEVGTPRAADQVTAVPANLNLSPTSAIVAAGKQGQSQPTDPCVSGCCHCGGAGCCGAWLPPVITLLNPPNTRFALARVMLGGAGVTPDALPEPPNSLA
jgi:hypothetical protein